MKAGCMRLLGLAIFLAVMAGDGIGVEEKQGEKKKKMPVIAVEVVKVEIHPPSTRDEEEVFTTIEDAKKIAELLSFFPELGQDSDDVGADWSPNYDLKLLRKNGESFEIDVRLTTNMNCWRGVGMGDWLLKDPDGFKKLIDAFFKNKEKKKAKVKQAPNRSMDGPRKASEILADVVDVEIQRALNRKKRQLQEQSVTIEDKKKIAKLLAFFPEIGQRSDHTGLWVADYHIKFRMKSDDPVDVRVSWDLKWWTDSEETIGHWRLKHPEKFEKLVDDWIKKK